MSRLTTSQMLANLRKRLLEEHERDGRKVDLVIDDDGGLLFVPKAPQRPKTQAMTAEDLNRHFGQWPRPPRVPTAHEIVEALEEV